MKQKFYVNEEEVSAEQFKSELEDAVREDVTANFDDFLDEIYSPYHIGNLTFLASQVLKLDEVAYREFINDEVDIRYQDAEYDFDDTEEYRKINGVSFETKFEEDEED